MNIKIGMNMLLWGTEITPAHIPIFEQLAEAGYDGVEIPVGPQTPAQLQEMATACDELGLLRTAVAFVGPDANPVSPDQRVRAAAVDSLKASIDASEAIGADFLGGGIYQAHKYFTGQGPTGQEWNWSAEYLHECGEYAAGKGITLGLEVLNRFEVFLLNTVADAKRMVDQVGLANVGIHYDTHHSNIEEPNPIDAIPMAHGSINHVHLSESHRGTLGTGQVDWQSNFKALKDSGYSGWLTIEAFGTSDPGLAEAANVWRNAFDSEQEVFQSGIKFIRERL